MPPGAAWPYRMEAGPLSSSTRSKAYSSIEPDSELIGNLLPFRYSGAEPVTLKPRTVKLVEMRRCEPPDNGVMPAE